MTIHGVPLHPLVVHAAVVFTPLAAVAAAAELLPRWRWATRWVALALVALSAGSVQLAAMTGDDLKRRVGPSALIETHEMWAGRLQVATWVLAAVVLVAFWVLPHTTPLRGGRDRSAHLPVLILPLTVLMPVVAIVVLVLVVLTGDAGARAVWAG